MFLWNMAVQHRIRGKWIHRWTHTLTEPNWLKWVIHNWSFRPSGDGCNQHWPNLMLGTWQLGPMEIQYQRSQSMGILFELLYFRSEKEKRVLNETWKMFCGKREKWHLPSPPLFISLELAFASEISVRDKINNKDGKNRQPNLETENCYSDCLGSGGWREWWDFRMSRWLTSWL